MSFVKISRVPRSATFGESLVMIVICFAIVMGGVIGFKLDAHMPMFLATAVCCAFGWYQGYKWQQMETAILNAIVSGLQGMMIIMVIGMVVGTWIASGTVPYMIYWGLQLLSPKYFLVCGCAMCAIMSMACGSSWTTAGTLGLALMGVGQGMGIPAPIIAGAVVSGAYFGDKQSPLSDTTNFAASVAGTSLYEHVNSMLYTTAPSMVISLLIYFVIGLRYNASDVDLSKVNLIADTLAKTYNFTPLLLIPLVVLLIIIVKKVPALLGMSIGALMGLTWAWYFQGMSFGASIQAMHAGFTAHTGVAEVDKLLSRGGMLSMMWTISIMMWSLGMAGILELTGVLSIILEKSAKAVKNSFGLITCTVWSTWILSFFASDPYLSMLLPARTFGPAYDKLKINRKVLSRSLEDGGTVVAPMVPWGSNGVFISTTLGVPTLSYIRWYFFGLINPFTSVIMAYLGLGIWHVEDKKDVEAETSLNQMVTEE